MNFILAERFAEAARIAADECGLSLSGVDVIGSHGQTVWHEPQPDGSGSHWVRSTLQIGDISVLAKLTGIITVGDFRPADMAVGGQGAPLTPLADYLLLQREEKGGIVQNIGGIGNCTVLPAAAQPAEVSAFDTGPGNMVIDQAVWHFTAGKCHFDRDGQIAAKGRVHQRMLEAMLAHPYFSLTPPKTTGRETFGSRYTERWIDDAEREGLSAEDAVATFTAFTAHSIVNGYERFVFPRTRVDEVIVCGGGVHNRTLMRMLRSLLPKRNVVPLERFGMSSDAREAAAFALLAHQFLSGRANNLPSVTGAGKPVIMGKLALPH